MKDLLRIIQQCKSLLIKKKSLVTNIAIFYGLSMALSLIFSVVATRHLDPERYGLLRYVLTILPFLSICTLPGYDTITLKEVNCEEEISILDITKIKVMVGSIFSVFAFLLFSNLLMEEEGVEIFFYISILLFFPFFETGSNFKNNLYARKEQTLSLGLQIISKILFIILFVSVVFLINRYQVSPNYILPAYLLAGSVSGHSVNFYAAIFYNSCGSKKSAFLHIKEAVTLSGATGVSLLSSLIDRLFVYHLLGKETMAKYSILMMIPMELGRFLDFIFIVFYKKIFLERNNKRILHRIRNPSFVFLLCAVAVFYCFLFKMISPLVFGNFYKYEYLTIFLSAASVIGITFEYFFIHTVFALGNAYRSLSYSVTSALTTVILIPIFGIPWKMEGVLFSIFLKCFLAPFFFASFWRYFRKNGQKR